MHYLELQHITNWRTLISYHELVFCVSNGLPLWITEWDPWGVPEDYECEVIENDAPVPKHVPLHRPGPLPEEFYKTLETITTGTLEDITIKKKDPSIA